MLVKFQKGQDCSYLFIKIYLETRNQKELNLKKCSNLNFNITELKSNSPDVIFFGNWVVFVSFIPGQSGRQKTTGHKDRMGTTVLRTQE